MRHQRQRPWLAGHVVKDGIDQAGLQPQPRHSRRPLHGLAEFIRCHGAHENILLQLGCQLGVVGTAPIKVGPDGGHHDHPAVVCVHGMDQAFDESLALYLVAAQGKDLLELVDDQQQLHVLWPAGEQLLDDQVQRPRVGFETPQNLLRCEPVQ